MTIGRGSPYVFQSLQIINSKYCIVHLSSIHNLFKVALHGNNHKKIMTIYLIFNYCKLLCMKIIIIQTGFCGSQMNCSLWPVMSCGPYSLIIYYLTLNLKKCI